MNGPLGANAKNAILFSTQPATELVEQSQDVIRPIVKVTPKKTSTALSHVARVSKLC